MKNKKIVTYNRLYKKVVECYKHIQLLSGLVDDIDVNSTVESFTYNVDLIIEEFLLMSDFIYDILSVADNEFIRNAKNAIKQDIDTLHNLSIDPPRNDVSDRTITVLTIKMVLIDINNIISNYLFLVLNNYLDYKYIKIDVLVELDIDNQMTAFTPERIVDDTIKYTNVIFNFKSNIFNSKLTLCQIFTVEEHLDADKLNTKWRLARLEFLTSTKLYLLYLMEFNNLQRSIYKIMLFMVNMELSMIEAEPNVEKGVIQYEKEN